MDIQFGTYNLYGNKSQGDQYLISWIREMRLQNEHRKIWWLCMRLGVDACKKYNVLCRWLKLTSIIEPHIKWISQMRGIN